VTHYAFARAVTPYAFISPFYILYLLFFIVPIGGSIYLSLTQWSGLGTPAFTGLSNYRHLFNDASFYTALFNTLIYVLISVLIVVPLSLFLAQTMNVRGLKARDFWRLTFFAPMVLSPIVVALVFGLLYNKQFGLLNVVLQAVLGIGVIDWLGDPTWAKASVGLLIIWRWTGYLSIFFLAGLQAIPKELYEASSLDGAGAVNQFRHVTLPLLQPVTAFVAVTVLIGSSQIFDEPYLLTSGGPGESTLSVAMFIFRSAFQRQQLGYASAAAVVLFIMVFVLARLASRLSGIGRES